MDVNNVEEKNAITAVRTPSLSTVSPHSSRYFDARSWEENKDILSLRIQSPVSELYLDGEFSPNTVIGSPDSVVDIKTPQVELNETNDVQCEDKSKGEINFNFKMDNTNSKGAKDGNSSMVYPFSKRITYITLSILICIIFIIILLATFFYFETYRNWNHSLLQALEFEVNNINIDFVPEDGFENMETSILVNIMSPLKSNSLYKYSNIHLDFGASEIEWNSFPVARIVSPSSVDIFGSDSIDVTIETNSNSTNAQGISGIIRDIFTKGMTEVSVSANVDNPNYLSRKNLEFVTRKFTVFMPLKRLITNIQITDIMLNREMTHNSNIIFHSKVSYDYRGRIFVRNLGKIFFGVFHDNNYLGVLNINDSELLSGKKTDSNIYGTLNMNNFINDKKLVNSLMPSIDFGENTNRNIPIKSINLDIHGVGSSSILLDSAVISTRTSVSLAILPPPPLRQIPFPSIIVESVIISKDNSVKIKGILRTTFYGYLISNNHIPKIESLIIEGVLNSGGLFKITSHENSVEDVDLSKQNEINEEINGSEKLNNNNNTNNEEQLYIQETQTNYSDGVPYNTVTISPYTDKYEIGVNMEIIFDDISQIHILNDKRNIMFANNINISTSWSFFTGFHHEKKNIEKSQFQIEMFNFFPKIIRFSIENNVLEAEISLKLLYLDDFGLSKDISYTGPLKVSWYCNMEFVSDYILSEITVNQVTTNYLLRSTNLIPEKCKIDNSDIKVEVYK